ncbi:MAG: hypothetical protein ABH833_00380 [Parcubacteria group bacterium]
MDFNKLKEFAKKFGGVLVMNGNEPDFVVMDYNRYLELERGASHGNNVIDKGNDNIDAVFEQFEPEHSEPEHHEPAEPKLIADTPMFDRGSEGDQGLIDNLNKEIQALNEEIKDREKSSGIAKPVEV